MNIRSFLCITLLCLCHPQLWPQALTKEFPRDPSGTTSSADVPAPQRENAGSPPLPDAPSAGYIPVAEPEAAAPTGTPVRIRANQQRKQGDIWTLTGEVAIEYRDYILRADRITYNGETEQAEAEGHLQLEGGPDDELIGASHGTVNLGDQTGRFYDVIGTIGVRQTGHKAVYSTANPFLFTGKVVIKSGPQSYKILDGSMTSCRLPEPDWRLMASEIAVDNEQARASNTTFRLLGIPVLYLPYVTHPIDTLARQSGFLIPTMGSSTIKGTIVGESVYWAIARNADMTLGAEYYSKRGWAPNGEFRYRGFDRNFFTVRFHSLLDRAPAPGNQGGTDMTINGRRDFSEHSRAVSNLEYLSSYVYRQAFTESFANAVNSEVKSDAFLAHSNQGWNASVRFDRYQSFQSIAPGNEIRILRLPSLDFDAVDHPIERTRLYWGLASSLAGLSRSEPGFQTSREVGRLDLYPRLSLPLHYDGWTLRPEIGVRDTFYSKSQRRGVGTPVERGATLNRSELETGVEIRPPALERTFTSGWLVNLLGREIRHTIEPRVQYSFITGINDFKSILRFDETDIASNTNEVEYALTQHFFTRSLASKPCVTNRETGTQDCERNSREWISWQVAQKYFIDPHFGGALTPGRRNVLVTTLDLTGVAFLVNPRDISPVISRLRGRTSEHTDLEWDLDYDTRAGRIESSNVFANYHHGDFLAGMSHARLDAPEETPSIKGPIATVTDFNQLRVFAGYGNLARRGLNLAGNIGYDFAREALEYGGMQTTYNWDCCGISFEYSRFALGSVRNENQYRFNFTLAGVGTAGNLRRAERIF